MRDLADERGLSATTAQLFNIRNNGSGWLYDTKTMNGQVLSRWKSYYSQQDEAPEDERGSWAKYRWYPEKTPDAKYFYPPALSLSEAVKNAGGDLWMVGGEIGVMSMIDAGIMNVTCTYGDTNIPSSINDDLQKLGVKRLRLIPDRDKSGEMWAMKIRDCLQEITLECNALPYPLQDKHGKDVNDYWRQFPAQFKDNLDTLDDWSLPKPQPKLELLPRLSSEGIPERLKFELRYRLGIAHLTGRGFGSKNIQCPFHDDTQPSASWNDETATLHCFGGCNREYLAKDLCEHFGIRMGDFYDAPTLPMNTVTGELLTPRPVSIEPRLSPPLLQWAQLSDEQMMLAPLGRRWLNRYVDWCVKASPLSPDIFFEALGLWTLSTAATRRLKLVIGGENIYPNLYIFIVATTTVYRKTTALNIANRILRDAKLDCLKLPERATPEAMFEYLAGKTPINIADLSKEDEEHFSLGRTFAAQRGIIEDEASGLLSEMKKDYMAGLSEILLKGYDGDATLHRLLKSQGLLTVKDMCLTFLGATTPIEWARRITQDERQNGFVARFGIITPEHTPQYQDVCDEIEPPTEIVKQLRRLFLHTLPWSEDLLRGGNPYPLAMGALVRTPECATVSVHPDAMTQMNEYRKAMGFSMLKAAGGDVDEQYSASYARLGTMVFKIAMLLAAVDGESKAVRIEPCHAYAAQLICERWRESLHRLDKHVAESRYNGDDEKLLRFIRAAGEVGVTEREICRACNIDSSKLRDTMRGLVDGGLVENFKYQPPKGRPSIRFKVLAQV